MNDVVGGREGGPGRQTSGMDPLNFHTMAARTLGESYSMPPIVYIYYFATNKFYVFKIISMIIHFSFSKMP